MLAEQREQTNAFAVRQTLGFEATQIEALAKFTALSPILCPPLNGTS
jgi:hypothetical protein